MASWLLTLITAEISPFLYNRVESFSIRRTAIHTGDLKSVVNKLSWLQLAFSLFRLSLIHFDVGQVWTVWKSAKLIWSFLIEMKGRFSELLYFWKARLMSALFSSCAVLSKIWKRKVFTATKYGSRKKRLWKRRFGTNSVHHLGQRLKKVAGTRILIKITFIVHH